MRVVDLDLPAIAGVVSGEAVYVLERTQQLEQLIEVVGIRACHVVGVIAVGRFG